MIMFYDVLIMRNQFQGTNVYNNVYNVYIIYNTIHYIQLYTYNVYN